MTDYLMEEKKITYWFMYGFKWHVDISWGAAVLQSQYGKGEDRLP